MPIPLSFTAIFASLSSTAILIPTKGSGGMGFDYLIAFETRLLSTIAILVLSDEKQLWVLMFTLTSTLFSFTTLAYFRFSIISFIISLKSIASFLISILAFLE